MMLFFLLFTNNDLHDELIKFRWYIINSRICIVHVDHSFPTPLSDLFPPGVQSTKRAIFWVYNQQRFFVMLFYEPLSL